MWQLLLHLSLPVFLTALAVCAIVALFGVLLKNRSPRLVERVGAVALVLFTVIYIALLVEPVNGWGAVGQGSTSIDLVPLSFLSGEHVTENSLHWQEWMLNLLLFVPLGIIAALVLDNRWATWLLGPALSLLIEGAQAVLATGRQSTVDDLLANGIGYLTGVCFVLLAGRIITRDDHSKQPTT